MHEIGDVVSLRDDDARKLTLVLRARDGAGVDVIDSAGRVFAGRAQTDAGSARVELLEERMRAAEPGLEVTLAQAVPKGAKMDFVIEKATELGVARIVPLLTERTIGDASPAKLERWRRLARAAATQSGRQRIPDVGEPVKFDRFLAAQPIPARVLLPWELAERTPLRERLPQLLSGGSAVAVLIGPEGGFSHCEVDGAIARGADVISLGSRILRTETAGLVVVSALLYEAGEL